MLRTVIGAFLDGHLFVDRQAKVSNRKITGDKRKKELDPESWTRVDRTIYRGSSHAILQNEEGLLVSGASTYPGNKEQAEENERIAREYRSKADTILGQIDFQNQRFDMRPKSRRVVNVVITDEPFWEVL